MSDRLELADNKNLATMIEKHGDPGEKVLYSNILIKINKKGKKQERCLLITDKALWNIHPPKQGKFKSSAFRRRIEIGKISGLTTSNVSDEFVLHVPDEYDYRYVVTEKSERDEIINLLKKQVKSQGQKFGVQNSDLHELGELAMSKADARLLTREEIMKRKQELAALEVESDEEDRQAAEQEGGDDISNMLSTPSKVRLKDFELLKVLGRGAFGKVMQVKKRSDGKIYAMKILKKSAIVDRNQVEHTKAERAILEQLSHPFLMTLRFAFQSKDKLYLVLDYFQGGELFFHLKTQRRFSEDVARIYVAEIALAFGHLHSLGVIYRDLKPENVLLDDNGHVCLTDFGLAKELKEDEKTQTFCGTPEYLAPEIIETLGHDKGVDWWSLGILLYELTVGIPPFYSQNVNEMYEKIRKGKLKFPPFSSEPCRQLIIQLLNRDPDKRLGSVNDVEDIKKMEFFNGIDWDKLYKKEVDVPFRPSVKNIADTSNFDEEFLQEPVVDSVVQGSQQQLKQGRETSFEGFTFAGDKSPLG